jgi:hypothetical protein
MYDPWQQRAACRGAHLNFFPEDEAEEPTLAHWCKFHCPVMAECRTDALIAEAEIGMSYGVVGGLTAAERRRLVVADKAADRDVIDDYLAAYPDLPVRGLAQLIRQDGGPGVSYRTLARRRADKRAA